MKRKTTIIYCARVLRLSICAMLVLLCAGQSRASVFGDVRGIVFDPQHGAIAGANLRLRSKSSDFAQDMQSAPTGEFLFRAIPIGEYTLTIEAKGFKSIEQSLTVISGNAPVLHFFMTIAPVSQRVDVVEDPEAPRTDSATPTSLIPRQEISQTPGSDRTNSLAFITNFVPGSYMSQVT